MINFKKILATGLIAPMTIALCFSVFAAFPSSAAENSASGFSFDSATGTITGYDNPQNEGNLTIPSKIDGVAVKSIGKEAFINCGFCSVTIPDSVTTIGERAFNMCFNLESINIPKSVANVGSMAFADCQNLKSISVDSENLNYTAENGVLFSKDKTTLIQYPIGKKQAYAIPSGVKIIGDNAFYDSMENLTSVTIPNTVTDIGSEAFSGCTGLSSIVIPNIVKTIGDRAFFYCSKLTSVTIPDSVLKIGNSPFGFCQKLEGITVDVGSQNYSSENGILFSKDKSALIQYPAGKAQTSYTVSDSVTTIGDAAFGWCNNLGSINLTDSVTSIGENAFIECESLTSVNLPSKITTISDGEFAYCGILTSIKIPENVKSIGADAFKMCGALSTVKIPHNVISIGCGAFGESGLTAIDIPNSVTKIDDSAFWRCGSLTSITIPSSVTAIGKGVFRECPSLEGIIVDAGNKNYMSENGVLFNKDKTHLIQYPAAKNESSFVLPDSVTTIENFAFSESSNLKKLAIPKSVTTFGEAVFMNCENLTIYSAAGSAAQAYAEKVGIPFIEMQNKTSQDGKVVNPKTVENGFGSAAIIALCVLTVCCGAAVLKLKEKRYGSK